MRLPRPRLTAAVLTVCVSAAIVLGIASPAEAHKHPTPVQLIAPAVDRIVTSASVSISLIEHNSLGATGRDITLVQRSYTVPLGTGSGFTVSPTGTVVTSTAVTQVNLDRARVWAVNHLFAERYGTGAPMPADPFSKAPDRGNTGDVVNQRLQRCYSPNTTDETGGCVVFATPVITVQPFVSDQKQFGDLPAQVIYPTAGKTSNVAVLKVGGSSMPSVNLGTTNAKVEAVSTMGFTAVPSNESSIKSINGHMTATGSSTLKVDEFIPQIQQGFRNGMTGGPVVSEVGQVVGMLTPAGKTFNLIGPEQISDALAAVNITPSRGPTDILYENALHNYNNALYTAAAPNLAQVLKLYPGHALAAEKLAIADQRKGTSADKGSQGATDTSGFGSTNNNQSSSSSGGNKNVLLWGGLAAVVVLLVLGAVLLRGRRGKAEPDEPDAPTPDPNLAPAGYVHPALGAPYPGPAGAPTSAPPSAWPTSAPPSAWPASAPPGSWADPNQAAPYSGAPYGVGPYAPRSGVPYQGGPQHPGGAPFPGGADPAATATEQQTVMRLSPSNPPPIPGGGAEAPVSTGSSVNPETAPTGVMARQNGAAPCDHCGQQLQPGQQFCSYCGNRAH